MEEMQRHYRAALGLADGPRRLLALVALVVGLWLINALVRDMERAMARRAFDGEGNSIPFPRLDVHRYPSAGLA